MNSRLASFVLIGVDGTYSSIKVLYLSTTSGGKSTRITTSLPMFAPFALVSHSMITLRRVWSGRSPMRERKCLWSLEYSCHTENKCRSEEPNYYKMERKIFIIIKKHKPTSIRRSPRRKVGSAASARQSSKPFAKRHVPSRLT